MSIAETALEYVREDSVIGLGTGHAASDFIWLLGARVQAGLKVQGVATSSETEALAQRLGIPLIGLSEVDRIETTFDGADAVDPKLNLIKGLGGALLREKVVAASSNRLVILVGEEKLTERLGLGYCNVLPIEIVPFSLPLVKRELAAMGLDFSVRGSGEHPYQTDNGNAIIDITLSERVEPTDKLAAALDAIPGVIETGLFLEMADEVLIQYKDGRVEARRRQQ